jgi:alpha-D-xyloside xylohydrolase
MLRALLCAAASLCVAAQPPQARLTPFGDDSIRVQLFPEGTAFVDPPLQALLDAAPPRTTLATGDGVSALSNGNIAVSVDPATALITVTRVSDGAVLLRQTALVFAAPSDNATRAGSVSARVTFAGSAGEKVYGLGEHRTGVVNQMPYFKRFADSQDYAKSSGSDVSIPFYASSRGYAFIWNSPAYGTVNITEDAISWFANATLGVDMWITTTPVDMPAGSSPYAPLLTHYADAVGHASRMPFYATGFFQCKDRYRNQTQLLDVARGYVERNLPISVIVIDWKHWVSQGDWHLDPRCWPDPQGMADELETMGIRLMSALPASCARKTLTGG